MYFHPDTYSLVIFKDGMMDNGNGRNDNTSQKGK
jgi:hypothetical protein